MSCPVVSCRVASRRVVSGRVASRRVVDACIEDKEDEPRLFVEDVGTAGSTRASAAAATGAARPLAISSVSSV